MKARIPLDRLDETRTWHAFDLGDDVPGFAGYVMVVTPLFMTAGQPYFLVMEEDGTLFLEGEGWLVPRARAEETAVSVTAGVGRVAYRTAD